MAQSTDDCLTNYKEGGIKITDDGHKKFVAEEKAIITDIQRFSVHDGMGIRTLVFFKGCPLRCAWCQNPETYLRTPELMYSRSECIGCGACIDVCPEKAITIEEDLSIKTNRDKCVLCGKCVDICYANARKIVGKEMSVDDVYKEVMKDEVFYKHSGGGVTLSGGEVTIYPAFASSLLSRLKNSGVHTAIETSGYCKWENMKKILNYTDLVLFDIKHPYSEQHKHYTGVENKLILDNLKKICLEKIPIIIRFPMIPGVNDDPNIIKEVAKIAINAKAIELHILPFHQVGEPKWYSLDKNYTFASKKMPTKESLLLAKSIICDMGINVNIGGTGN